MFEHAPSVDLLGSFFPVWMVCIVAALVLTIAVRWLLIRTRLETELGPRVIVYPSMVVLFACSIWLFAFRY
jgi:YtcA family